MPPWEPRGKDRGRWPGTAPSPEIAWLDKYYVAPPLALAAAMYLAGGIEWLVWGFCVPTVTLAPVFWLVTMTTELQGSVLLAAV